MSLQYFATKQWLTTAKSDSPNKHGHCPKNHGDLSNQNEQTTTGCSHQFGHGLRTGECQTTILLGLSENSVPLNPMVLLIIIPIKWL